MGHIQEKKRKKRLALMESAYTLFTDKGTEHTTISEIADRAGVAKGTFYLYFRDKTDIRDSLTRAVSRQLLTQSCNRLDDHISSSGLTMEAADIFIFIINDLLETVSADPQMVRFLNKNLSWGLLYPSVSERGADAASANPEQDIENLVLSRLDRYGVRVRDLKLLLYTLLELVSSTCYDVILYGEPVSLDEYRPYLSECVRLLVNNSVIPD